MKIEWNEEGLAQLQADLEQHFAGGLTIPLEGSEADAIENVKQQLRDLGTEPNDAEVERIVREARS